MIRKWIYKLRYILIILSALLGLLGLSWTFWACLDYWSWSNWVDYCYDVWSVNYIPCNTTDKNCSFEFDSYWNFWGDLNYFWGVVQLFSNTFYSAYGWRNWNFVKLNNRNSESWNLYTFSWACYWSLINDNIRDYWARAFVWEPCFSSVVLWSSSFSNLELFWSIDMIFASYVNEAVRFCFASSSSSEVLCFFESDWITSSTSSPSWITAPYNLVNIWSNFFTLSPFNTPWWGWSISLPLSSDDLLRYFRERYGWSDSMCYVWTNTTAMWWDNVSFQYWTWATIFELFNSIYWAWNWTQYIVNVWTWINSWLLNYNYWFNWSNNCYNYYSWWQVVSDCSYTRFPFAWQKTAIYFMADLLNSRGVSDDWNLWYEFAVFCDNVFNWSDSAPIKEGSALQSNSSSYITYQNLYYWTSSVINSWDQLSEIFWTWNWYNDWNTSSWVVDLDSFFNKFNWFIDNFSSYFIRSDYQSTRAILPDYIIVAFCLILLFGIIRK